MPRAREEPVEIEAKGIKIMCATPFKRQLWCWLIIGFVGCHAATPLPASAPPPPAPMVEAPPAPKCDKVEDACVAAAETRARLGQVDWQFAPPVSWIYAQGEDLTIATDKKAVMGVTIHQTVEVKNRRAEREEALRLIARQLGVTIPKKKSFIPKRPEHKQKVGDLDADFYLFEGAKLDDRTGQLLFFVINASSEQVVVGAGFVSDDDSDNADQAIMTAIQSLQRTGTDGATASTKAP
jgi:hypothetical protein